MNYMADYFDVGEAMPLQLQIAFSNVMIFLFFIY